MRGFRSSGQLSAALAPLAIVLLMVGSAALGIQVVRTNVAAIRAQSQDNVLWSATQMEVELTRFQHGLAVYALEGTPRALDDLKQRFDILWSRVRLMTDGRVGALLRQYDEGFGTLDRLADYLAAIDPVILNLRPGDAAEVAAVRAELAEHQRDMRLYTLRVVRADTAAASQTRDTIATTAGRAALLALIGCLLGAVALVLFALGRAGRTRPAAA